MNSMKTIFNKILFAIMAVSVCFSVISCDDETGEETVNPNALKEINAMYSLNLSEDYLYFYDITITYGYDDNKEIVELPIDNWGYQQTYSTDYMETLPNRFFCTIQATPKNPIPTIDESKIYEFEYSGACNLAGFTGDGKKIMSKNVPHGEKHLYGGSKMQGVLNKGTKTLVSFEFARK